MTDSLIDQDPAARAAPSSAGRAEPGQPVLSRRHTLSPPSARSLLLTILGELVLPAGQPVWTSALVEVLSEFGVEEKAARQALARTATDGWIAAERDGRRVRWTLTPPGHRLLTEGAERIYSLGAEKLPWDGRWLILSVTVPEHRRKLRLRLHTRLRWAGLGNPVASTWVTPNTGREAEVKQILEDLGLGGEAFLFIGPLAGVGTEQALAQRAWDLEEVSASYADFLEEFSGAHPGLGTPTLFAQVRLVHAWRRFPFLDPQLPQELLPPNWIGYTAAARFRELHDTWHDGSQRRWAELTAG